MQFTAASTDLRLTIEIYLHTKLTHLKTKEKEKENKTESLLKNQIR